MVSDARRTAASSNFLQLGGMRVRVFPHAPSDVTNVPGGQDQVLLEMDSKGLPASTSSSSSSAAPNGHATGNGHAADTGSKNKSIVDVMGNMRRVEKQPSQYVTPAAPNFVFDAAKTKPATGLQTQWLARKMPTGEVHLYPAGDTYSLTKRLKTEKDLGAALELMKRRDAQQAADRRMWDGERKSKPISGDTHDALTSSKRPFVRTGCSELDDENRLIRELEDPSLRAAQKFQKEDPEFRKKRKLLEERLKVRKLEADIPTTAAGANFLKHREDDEFDWDGEENDRFSDDDGNDGGADENAAMEPAMHADGLADADLIEKDEKYKVEEGDGAGGKVGAGGSAAGDGLEKMLKEKEDNESAQLARDVAEFGGLLSETSANLQKLIASSGDPEKSLGETISDLFEKPKRSVVGIEEILKALKIDGKTEKTSAKWKQTMAHLKQFYVASKNASGGFVFSKKPS